MTTISKPLLSVLIAALMLGSACSARVEYPAPADRPSAGAIDINTATADELEHLPAIGRKIAEAIVAHRVEHGRFRRAEHLLLVRGISETKFKEIRPAVRAEMH